MAYMYCFFFSSQLGTNIQCQGLSFDISGEALLKILEPENKLIGVSVSRDGTNTGLNWKRCIYTKDAGLFTQTTFRDILSRH